MIMQRDISQPTLPGSPERPDSGPLYQNFTSQAGIDAQYDVENSVPNFGIYVDFFLENSARVREKLSPKLDVLFGPTVVEHLDIYPAKTPDAPIHMFIHGGYWHSLSSKEFSFVAEGLVAAGITVVVNNYALCPDVTITEIVRQNRAAIAWLYRNALTFGADQNRIFVSGHSAGGHLTAMLLSTDWAGAYGLPADLVKGGTSISGLFELAPFFHSWLQPKLQLTPKEIALNSPINHLPTEASPLIVTLGGDESEEFHRQSDAYLTAWKEKGLAGEYLDLPGRNHFTVLEDYLDPDSPLCQAIIRQMSV
jgi:arylformamidase